MSRASKEYSNNLQDKVKRLIAVNHQLRDELQAKDQEIADITSTASRLVNEKNNLEAEIAIAHQTISSLMDAQDNWIAERVDLQAVIEKQSERIRYLEKQYRDLNPKGVNQ